jgi:tetraacyldisaccharide 4'-kinase
MITIPLSWIYGLGARIFHERYDKFPFMQYRTTVPVVSVGNLSAGGTGKTPFAIALSQLLMEMEPRLAETEKIAILSRGYGRLSHKLVEVRTESRWEDAGDEPILIKRKVPPVAVLVHADRRELSAYAINRLGSKILLLDDGFQHRALARNLDIVLVAGDYPLGNGWRLPAGPLRESPSALERASILVGIGADVEAAAKLATKYDKPFAQAVPRADLPEDLKNSALKVFVLTSIANPSRFVTNCEAQSLNICGKLFFPDHHVFTSADYEKISRETTRSGAEVILTTEKDQIRLGDWNGEIAMKAVGYALELRETSALISVLEPIVRHVGLT